MDFLKKLKSLRLVKPTWREALAASSCGAMVYMGLAWNNDWLVAGGIAFAMIDCYGILAEARHKREMSGA